MTEEKQEGEAVSENVNVNNSKEISSVEENSENVPKLVSIKQKKPASQKTNLEKIEPKIPRGRPKSGRPWKTVKEKFSKNQKSIYRRSLNKKLEYRQEIQHIKQLSKSIKDAKKEEKEEKNKRRLENAERRLENQRKSEIVQIIKNPSKLKRMKKKHLRMIEKRDLDKIKVV